MGMIEKLGQAAMMQDGDENIGPRSWPHVREAYESGEGTIEDVCERFGVTKGALEYRRRRDDWLMRSERDPSARSLLLGRMFKVLDQHITRLENLSMDEQDGKEVGLLSVAVRTFEKLDELNRGEPGNVPKQKKDMRDLRDKLARRLDQLKQR
ncbi:hypothetical protein [Devosia sp.]|uniref:hypothetical protein n=1 Tax=Devosia sp. TaxID=1871048 RepID=UPI00260E5C14|nr:hypothetical protein [Devosia sp.]